MTERTHIWAGGADGALNEPFTVVTALDSDLNGPDGTVSVAHANGNWVSSHGTVTACEENAAIGAHISITNVQGDPVLWWVHDIQAEFSDVSVTFTNPGATRTDITTITIGIDFQSHLTFAAREASEPIYGDWDIQGNLSPVSGGVATGGSFHEYYRSPSDNDGDEVVTIPEEIVITFEGTQKTFDFSAEIDLDISEFAFSQPSVVENFSLSYSIEDMPAGVTATGGFVDHDDCFPIQDLIIVTHGWQPGETYDPNGVELAEIETGLVERIVADGGNMLTTQIINFHWQEAYTAFGLAEYDMAKADTQTAGHRLAQQVLDFVAEIEAETGQSFDPNIHFIGHSLGTMVNAYAIGEIFEETGGSLTVEQMTILDDPIIESLFEVNAADFFYQQLPSGSVEYVENFYASETFTVPPQFGGPIAGAGPGEVVGGTTVYHGLEVQGADHATIVTEFYAPLIPAAGWVSPILPGWTPAITWDSAQGAQDNLQHRGKLLDWSNLNGNPTAPYTLDHTIGTIQQFLQGGENTISMTPNSPAEFGFNHTFTDDVMLSFNFNFSSVIEGTFNVQFGGNIIWSYDPALADSAIEDNAALITVSDLAGQTGLLKWVFEPDAGFSGTAYVNDIEFSALAVQSGTLIGTSAADEINGGTGDDNIYGDDGDDLLRGKDGNDALYGEGGEDELKGGEGNDFIFGGDDDDLIRGEEGDDYIDGGAGDDDLKGEEGDDTIRGGAGNDALKGYQGNNTLYGGEGDDTLYGGFVSSDAYAGDDLLDGGPGNDVIYGRKGHDTAYGRDGNDTILGEEGNDILFGGNGDDTLRGREGNDTAHGGEGVDDIRGDEGDDTLNGDAGNDVLKGGDDNDTLNGGEGDDNLSGNNGNDILSGGAGNDAMNGNSGDDELHGGDNDDNLYGENGFDTLYGDDGNDLLVGQGNHDILYGGNGNDSLYGDENGATYVGHDELHGEDGSDFLVGGTGNDKLYGGLSYDVLYGQDGADQFIFEFLTAFSLWDEIKDFSTAEGDQVDISDVMAGAGYDPVQDAINDFVTLTEINGDTRIDVDRDGMGGSYSPVRIAYVENITGQWTDAADMVSQGHLVAV